MKKEEIAKEKRKKMLKDIMGTIAVMVFICLFVCSIVWIEAQPNEISKDFCKESGFSKVTDEYTDGWDIIGVECDKEHIYFVCKEKECLSKDKWGNCDYRYYLEIQNNTIMGGCD